ncbi:restriction endonuclease subunit S [Streptomyces buecherae]|uniref:restriction endonuclease subunit S n=1 Tax=Streptomyces buecherae TaxID=2763006 RepID=UPI0033809D22
MSLNLDKSTWKRVRLGDVIRRSRTQADPANGDVDRYVGGGHIDNHSLTIERFGDVNDGQMGSTFTYLFQPGQILFVSARPYLRKSGAVNFSGVVADKTYVLDAVPENGLLQDFLPFVLASDHFIAYAIAEATGSMNPRLLWGQMQRYEFDLPPLDEQQRLADLLWAVEEERRAAHTLSASLASTASATFETYASRSSSWELRNWVTRIDAGRSPKASSQSASSDEFGVLKVSAVGPGVFVAEENKRLLSDEDFRPGDSVRAGDLLVTRANAVVGNVARPCLVEADYPNLMLSDKTLRIVPQEKVSTRVLLAALQARAYRAHVRESVGGTDAKNISQKRILEGPVPRLGRDEVDELEQCLQANDRSRRAARTRTEAASALKGSLSAEIFGDAK